MSRLTRAMNARSMFWKPLENVVHSGSANANRRVANNSRINSTSLHINHTRSHCIMNPIMNLLHSLAAAEKTEHCLDDEHDYHGDDPPRHPPNFEDEDERHG
jgi:hypothetical protein